MGIFASLGLLHLRLFQLQLIEHQKWALLAENNRLRRIPIAASRGRIFDRTGRVLASNRPAWQLLVFPDEADDLNRTVSFLASQGVVEADAVRQRFAARRTGTLAPLLIGENLSWEQVARVRSHQSDFPELSVINSFYRIYPVGAAAAHVVGYLRHITAQELRERPDQRADRLIGACGIEELAEDFVAGTDGERWVVASAVGRQLGVVREVPAVPGYDLAVTLDLRIQEAAMAALGEHAGAVVALDVHTGAVRALYSAPSFDPAIFTTPMSSKTWVTLSKDPGHPLQNRCLQGTYPPGSTIKPFLALAGLEKGLISASWTTYCTGAITLYGHRFRCWLRGGHGAATLGRSLEVSCDVYYYKLGQMLGIEGMAEWFRIFGLGQTTGIGLSNENPGLIGGPEWSQRVRHTPWYPGESVSVSIGQGPVLVTVLQLARAFAALANGGRLVRPHLIPESVSSSASVISVSDQALKEVVRGLYMAVHGSEGTARSLNTLPVVGKTGTAQVVSLPADDSPDELAPHLQHHAWFVGWTPVTNPEVAIAVLVEHGGGGGSVAAPAAATVFRATLESLDYPLSSEQFR